VLGEHVEVEGRAAGYLEPVERGLAGGESEGTAELVGGELERRVVDGDPPLGGFGPHDQHGQPRGQDLTSRVHLGEVQQLGERHLGPSDGGSGSIQ